MKPSHCYLLLWTLLFFSFPLFSTQDHASSTSRIMSQNSQYSVEIEPYFEKKFDVSIETPGKWYFWVETCGSPVTLTIENGQRDTRIMTIEKGGSYLHQEIIENKQIEESKSVTIRTVNEEDTDNKGRIHIYSAVIDEKKFVNYELQKESKWMKVSYKYQPYNSEVLVKFNPLKFESSTQSTDRIKYQITLFEAEGFFDKEIHCEIGSQASGVRTSEIEVPIDYKEQILVRFSEVWDGKYHVKVKAFVIHEAQIIRFYTYHNGYVNVIKPIFSNIFVVFVGGVALLLVVMVCQRFYKKVRAWDPMEIDEGEDVEKRKKKKGKKWYEAIEDETEEGDESVSSPSDVQVDS